jgi:esterase/lipase
MRPLANFLHHQGCTVYGPRLRGHGTSPEDLAGRTWEDWLTSVERGYLILATTCRDVVLGGFSMGSGLALSVAACNLPKVRAVFAINPPAKLRKKSARLVPAVALWNRLVDRISTAPNHLHFIPNDPENPDINYSRNPVTGLNQLMELMDRVAERLEEITVPTLVIQGSEDPIVHPEGTDDLYQRLGARDKEMTIFPTSRHVIIRGEGSQRVFTRVWQFISDRL